MNRILIFVVALFLTSCASHIITSSAEKNNTKPIAFPGAEGFGKYTTGGRGGEVLFVLNLNDGGAGSLRKAIQTKGPRIIVFKVSGTIALESPLDINNPDITIAGQSAPGDGIAIKNYPMNVKADNVIIRYMRFRLGDESKFQGDAFGGTKGVSNVIIDHCSMSWATDECASFYNNKDFTLQWCIISESLNHSVHEKGDHGYGGIWGGRGASFHHNLIASHNSRMPRFSGSSSTPNSADELVDFRNNVIYNWASNNIYGGEKGRYNIVGNYFRPGNATEKSKRDRLLEPYKPYGRFFLSDNYISGFSEISKDNWNGGVKTKDLDSVKAGTAFQVEPITTHTAAKAFDLVLKFAGASLKRDIVDSRVTQEVRNGVSISGKANNGIIDSQNDVGGWPELKSLPALIDSDTDGIPDDWEKENRLNSNDPSDSKAVSAKSFYTNIEVYLNSLVK